MGLLNYEKENRIVMIGLWSLMEEMDWKLKVEYLS